VEVQGQVRHVRIGTSRVLVGGGGGGVLMLCLLQFMCDKCDAIVARNYRVDGVARGQVVCFSCADRRGKKMVSETGYSDLGSSGNSGSAAKTHSVLEADQDGGLRDGSISSTKNDDRYPTWFDEEGKPSLVLEQPKPTLQPRQPTQQKASAARSSECTCVSLLVACRSLAAVSHTQPSASVDCSYPARDVLPAYRPCGTAAAALHDAGVNP